jgi:hypothetical protein
LSAPLAGCVCNTFPPQHKQLVRNEHDPSEPVPKESLVMLAAKRRGFAVHLGTGIELMHSKRCQTF